MAEIMSEVQFLHLHIFVKLQIELCRAAQLAFNTLRQLGAYLKLRR